MIDWYTVDALTMRHLAFHETYRQSWDQMHESSLFTFCLSLFSSSFTALIFLSFIFYSVSTFYLGASLLTLFSFANFGFTRKGQLMDLSASAMGSSAYLLCPLWLLPSRLNRLTPRNQDYKFIHLWVWNCYPLEKLVYKSAGIINSNLLWSSSYSHEIFY